ncbi:MAG: hypothetical protein EBU84_16460, partial [Actinobacteria bacterium]|nr:hypothetical protein [Actinomycetota bacterium]
MANSRKSRRNQAASRTSTAQLNKSYFHHEQDAAYADALVSLLSRANTILTGREINCGLSETVQIAATDGNTIYFNISEVAAMIRKLRITRSVPTKQQYDEAVSNIASGYWDMSRQAWQYRHHHLRNASAYLWRKYLEFPEIFKLPYEEFCSALVRKEMGTSIRAFATLRGLNYHELSHCLYTPTTGGSLRKTILDINEEFRQIRNHINFDAKQAFRATAVVCDAAGLDANDHKEICTVIADGQSNYKPESRHKWVAENMDKWQRFEKVCDWLASSHYWHKMWNVLEDQRIESLFVARFPSARHFFTATVLKYIATYRPDGQENRDEQKQGAGYLLLTGRKYISKKVRNTYRELLKSDYQLTDQQVAEFELLVEQFRKLSTFKSQVEVENAVGIIRALGLWCIKHISNPTSIPEPEGGFEHDSQAKTGKETGKRDSAEAQERREEQEERWEQEEEDSDGDDADSDSDSDSD